MVYRHCDRRSLQRWIVYLYRFIREVRPIHVSMDIFFTYSCSLFQGRASYVYRYVCVYLLLLYLLICRILSDDTPHSLSIP